MSLRVRINTLAERERFAAAWTSSCSGFAADLSKPWSRAQVIYRKPGVNPRSWEVSKKPFEIFSHGSPKWTARPISKLYRSLPTDPRQIPLDPYRTGDRRGLIGEDAHVAARSPVSAISRAGWPAVYSLTAVCCRAMISTITSSPFVELSISGQVFISVDPRG